MKVERFTEILGADYYTGVPDSQLRPLCDHLMKKYGIDPKHHIIASNEGNCVALAAGYHLATGKIPVVYMQNSGEGNIINPLASLAHEKVYSIPMIFVIGWRGEPGVHDEPQHIFQGEITLSLLDLMGVKYHVISADTSEEEVADKMRSFREELAEGHQVAFVIRKGALINDEKTVYRNEHTLKREDAIEYIAKAAGDGVIICTTGKASRELFEIRERNGQDHGHDFLTVGSMGHASSIALGIALQKPDRKVWCIDGDGAALMHMGAMAVIGANRPDNMVHVVINNGSHETVGGMPTVADRIDLISIARGCGYMNTECVDNALDLENALNKARDREGLSFIEVRCAIGSRADLGRPTTKPVDNKNDLMETLQACQ